MGMFEDVKAMQAVETATEKEMKNRFSLLEEKYKKSLTMIQSLCCEVYKLKKERAESLTAFALVSKELKKTKRQKAAIAKNRNFWKRESEATDYIRHLTEQRNNVLKEELKNYRRLAVVAIGEMQHEQKEKEKISHKKNVAESKLKQLTMTFPSTEKVAANIVPAIGK